MYRLGLLPIAALLFSGAACNDVSTPAKGDVSDEGAGEVSALRLLTRGELERSLQAVLGPVSVPPTAPDLRRAGLAQVGAGAAVISAGAVEQIAHAVDAVLAQIFADPQRRDRLIGCDAGDAACPQDFLRRVGQRAWRRPISSEEQQRYGALHSTCVELTGEATEGYRCVASALLQSPYFIYRVEAPEDGVWRGYAMASRLSYFLHGVPPDLALLKAAHEGKLDSAEGVRAQARRMLDAPQARAGIRAFAAEWYRLDRLDRLERDVLAQTDELLQFALGREGLLQPWLQWVAFAAQEELLRMIEHQVFEAQDDYLDLLTTRRTFVDVELERIYNLEADGEAAAIGSLDYAEAPRIEPRSEPDAMGFRQARHSEDSPRRGLLGTLAVLGQMGKQHETSPTRRGLYLRRRFLCLEVGEPPDDIDLCERPDGVSRRASLEQHHLCAASCASCHTQMDPPGYALDRFDTVGRYRHDDDWGYPLDTTVEWKLVGEDGNAQTLHFDSLRGLADAVKSLPEATSCVPKQIFRYATGREESAEEAARMTELVDAFASGGRKLKRFLVHFAGSDAFRRPPPSAPGSGPTLAQIAREIFGPHCGSCHISDTLGGLSLADDGMLAERLSQPSLGLPSMPLVTPGSPERSYLWHKVAGTQLDVGGEGSQMPTTGPLGETELARIRAWLEVTP